MNADDIKGLAKEQIRDKYSLPESNTMVKICDVFVPDGIDLEISYASPAFGGKGGGVQYQFIGGYDDLWFMNGRELP